MTFFLELLNQLLSESLQALLSSKNPTCLLETIRHQFCQCLVATISTRFESLSHLDVADLFVSLATVPQHQVDSIPRMKPFFDQIISYLTRYLSDKASTLNKHHKTLITMNHNPRHNPKHSFHQFLLRCSTGLALSGFQSPQLINSLFLVVQEQLLLFDGKSFLLVIPFLDGLCRSFISSNNKY